MASSDRASWTDERLDEKMVAIDHRFDRIETQLDGIRLEIAGLRGDIARLQDRLIQIGFGLAAVLFVQLLAMTATLIAALSR